MRMTLITKFDNSLTTMQQKQQWHDYVFLILFLRSNKKQLIEIYTKIYFLIYLLNLYI